MACARFELITSVFHYFRYFIGARPLSSRKYGRIFPYTGSILAIIRPARDIPLSGKLDNSSVLSKLLSASCLRDQMISFARVILLNDDAIFLEG